MKRNPFTLVEILVVIAVIAILMGLMFPALGMVKERAYMKQSLSDVKNIQMAVKSFKNDYQYLPIKPTTAEKGKDVVFYGSKARSTATTTKEKCNDVFKTDSTLQTDYLDLFNTLCYNNSDPTKNGVPPDDAKTLNPKKVIYLTPTSKFVGASDKCGFRDPWGRPYVVFLDNDYDNKISLPAGSGVPNDTIYGDVAVFGMGTFEPGTSDTIDKALKKTSQIVTSWQ